MTTEEEIVLDRIGKKIASKEPLDTYEEAVLVCACWRRLGEIQKEIKSRYAGNPL